jgi:hypothetical protein
MAAVDRFAYPVRHIADLAPPVAAALQATLLKDEAPRQIIFAPRQEHLVGRHPLQGWLSTRLPWQRTPDWVLALTDERLLLVTLPPTNTPPQVTATPLSCILWLELGTVLLVSWLEWCWAADGEPRRERVYFNTVGDVLFWKMLDAMRRTIITQAGFSQPAGKRPYEAFEGLPFKFKNLLPYRLLFPGEKVEALVFRPALWEQRLGVLRRQRAPAMALVLSPAHLLVAHDDRSNTGATHGLIARYCPRDRLRRCTLARPQDDLWLEVTLGVQAAEETLRLLFEPADELRLGRFLAKLPDLPDSTWTEPLMETLGRDAA